jgi:hypothetical protein
MQSINGQTYRTLSVVLKEREDQGLIYDGGFPTTCYSTYDELSIAVNQWHVQTTGYTVTKASKQGATSRCGESRMVRCKRAGKYNASEKDGSRPKQQTKKCDCPWMVWMEEVADTNGNVVWVVRSMDKAAVDYAKERNLEYVHLCHNHAPLVTHA